MDTRRKAEAGFVSGLYSTFGTRVGGESTSPKSERRSGSGTRQLRRWRRQVRMVIPPKDVQDLDEQYPAPTLKFNWNEDYQGTLKPGTDGDNFPLEDIMHVATTMHYVELDADERACEITEPDEDILEWLASKGRLLARGVEGDEDEVSDKTLKGITEEDLEFGDQGVSLYNRRDNPSQDPYATEYGVPFS